MPRTSSDLMITVIRPFQTNRFALRVPLPYVEAVLAGPAFGLHPGVIDLAAEHAGELVVGRHPVIEDDVDHVARGEWVLGHELAAVLARHAAALPRRPTIERTRLAVIGSAAIPSIDRAARISIW